MGAAFGTASDLNRNTHTYGNSLLFPLIGGSGAGGGEFGQYGDGGGGGGAILIGSNTRIEISGLVTSSAWPGRGGSGGAIRLVAPVVSGNGSLSVSGGQSLGGGLGRVRIDCTDFTSWRNLSVSGVASRGSRMIVFPAIIPRLDIVEVAGNAIPEGTNNAIQFELSAGASTNQTVKVQARNFTNDVPIRVVVMPENPPSYGYSGQFDAVILQASGNPPFTNVPVMIPAGSICHINAWTR
jgi:hypothetical protein